LKGLMLIIHLVWSRDLILTIHSV